MRCIYLIFATIALVSSQPVEKEEKLFDKVKKDLEDYRFEFRYAFRKSEIIVLRTERVLRYITSNHYKEFNEAFKSACNTPEALNVFDYLVEIGIFDEKYNKCPQINPSDRVKPPISEEKEELMNLVKDLKAVIDLNKIKEFQAEKLESSAVFKEFYEDLTSEKTQDLFKKFLTNPQVDKLHKTFKKYGIPGLDDIVYIIKIIMLVV